MRSALFLLLLVAPMAMAQTTVVADPFPTTFTWPEKIVYNQVVVSTNGRPDVYYAAHGGPFAAIGQNLVAPDVRLFVDLRTGKALGRMTGALANGPSIFIPPALSADGKWFAVASGIPGKHPVYVFDTATAKLLCEFPIPEFASHLACAGPEHVLVQEMIKGRLAVHHARTGQLVATAQFPDYEMFRKAVPTPGGKFFVQLSRRALDVYATATCERLRSVPFPPVLASGVYIEGYGMAPDGRRFATLVKDGSGSRVLCWDIVAGTLLTDLAVAPSRRWAVSEHKFAWTADGAGWLLYNDTTVEATTGKTIYRAPIYDHFGLRDRLAVNLGTVVEVEHKIVQPVHRLLTLGLPNAQWQAMVAAVQAGGAATDVLLPKLTAATRPTTVTTVPAAAAWTVRPDPGPGAAKVTRPVPLSVPVENVWRLRVTGGSKPLAIFEYAIVMSVGNKTDLGQPRVVRWVDLLTGKAIGGRELPPGCVVLATNPDGTLMTSTDADQRRVDVWGSDGQPRASWVPYPPGVPADSKVVWAQPVDAERVLTASSGGELTLWSIPACRAVYSVRIPGAVDWKASPGGRYVVAGTGEQLHLLESATGKLAGVLAYKRLILSDSEIAPRLLAFQPKGTELIANSFTAPTMRWNLATGAELGTLPTYTHQRWQYVGDDAILCDNRSLYSFKYQAHVWWYHLPRGGWAAEVPDTRVWYVAPVSERGPNVLVPLELPGPVETRTITEIAEGGNRLLAPGTKIALVLDVPPALKAPVTAQLTKAWAARGLQQVTTGADITLEITLAEHDTGEKLEFRAIGTVGQESIKPVRILEQSLLLRLQANGVTVWNPPTQKRNLRSLGVLALPPGQTDPETYLHQQFATGTPTWVEGQALPRFLAKVGTGTRGLPGHADLSAAGVVMRP